VEKIKKYKLPSWILRSRKLVDPLTFVLISIPTMILLGLRHALDADHITAIDNLVRLHNARRSSQWVGAGFSVGHMISVLAEMILIIYVVGNITNVEQLSFLGGVIGGVALGVIGAINIYSMKKWGKTGSAILASKVLSRMGIMKPFGSALITGMVFGLGFDTATQISAITLSAIASASLGVQVALILAGFFAVGMIPIDTLDTFILRSAFSRIFDKRGFRYMAYLLSAAALAVGTIASYETISNLEIFPDIIGPVLAVTIIIVSFGYAYASNKRRIVNSTDQGSASQIKEHRNDREDEYKY
jgi:high-affinity nickel-transport protein